MTYPFAGFSLGLGWRGGRGVPRWEFLPATDIYDPGTLAAPATDVVDPGTLASPATDVIDPDTYEE